MTITASSPAALAAGLRPLTADELARLDWLRTQLRSSGADVSDATALGALVDASRAGWVRSASTTVPDGMVAALAVGLGDALVARAGGASWVLRTVEGSSGPAVVDATGQAVVLPFEDLRSRWVEGRTAWVAGYVDAASAHLRVVEPVVPQPHPRPADEGAAPAPAPLPSRAAASGAGPLLSQAGAAGAQSLPGRVPAGGADALPRRGAEPAPAAEHPVAAPAAGPATPTGWQPMPVAGGAPHGLPRRGETAPTVARPGGTPTATPLGASAAHPAAGVVEPPATAGPTPIVAVASASAPGPAVQPDVRPARPADLPEPPSAAVQDLALRALEEALEVALSGGDALPLAVVPGGDRWQVRRFPGSTAADVRGWLTGSGAPCAALAWVGLIDGEVAVLAEASDAGRPGLTVGHRFAPRDEPDSGRRHARAQAAEPVGDLVLLGPSAPVV